LRYAPGAVVDHPLCPSCHDNVFVRAEQVISGRRVTMDYYCGRCNHIWHIQARHIPERRQVERRAMRIDVVNQLRRVANRVARASLRLGADRRKVKRLAVVRSGGRKK
jgi:hypothetical protein